MTLNFRTTVVLFTAVLCGAVGSAAADDATAESTGFRVEEAALDVGDVRAGSQVVGTFIFHNDGDQDVKIIRAKPS
jgi:hypothetical protein